MQAQHLNNIYSVVVELLGLHPHLRDSDPKLTATIWRMELGGQEKCEAMTAFDLLLILSNDEILTSADVITRARRKAQEKNLNLRGKKYLERQNHQSEVKDFVRKTR